MIINIILHFIIYKAFLTYIILFGLYNSLVKQFSLFLVLYSYFSGEISSFQVTH